MEEQEKRECCCRFKDVPRSEQSQKQLRNRLNRIIGQLNGIGKMLEDNRYCGDILTQLAAAESALQGLGYVILQEHMESCVTDKIKSGDPDIIAETVELVKKLK
jgi:DNA-binding FrmR family transcriptional regulator